MKSLVERLRLMSFVRDVSVAQSEGAVLGDILRSCAEAIVRNLDAALARIWTFNEKTKSRNYRPVKVFPPGLTVAITVCLPANI